MKSEAGITTTSIIIYVIAMAIVVGIIATITSFFYRNVVDTKEYSQHITEMTTFHMYFLEETTKQGNTVEDIGNHHITFSSGNRFTFQDQGIYLNHINICENVKQAEFSFEHKEEKDIVQVIVTIGESNEYTKRTEYVLATNR